MRNKFSKYVYSIILGVFFLFCIFAGEEEVHAGNSKYTYEISGKTIRKINLANGKIKTTKIKSNQLQAKYAMTYSSLRSKTVQEKNGYLYYTINVFHGSSYRWNYICRVNAKNGKGFQVLAKGYNAQIVGKRIYYTKSHFDPNDKKDESDKTVGVYSMKLDGSDKKQILLKKELICACQDYLYVKDLSDRKLMRYTLQGTEGRFLTEENGSFSGYFIMDNCLLYGIETYDNQNKKWTYGYISVNLKTGEVMKQNTPYEFVGAADGYLFFSGAYPSGGLYYRETKNSIYKKFSKKLYSPRLGYGGKQKYIMFHVNVKDYELYYNVLIDLKRNKLKRVSKYYVS